jgi:hypothetical protein
VYRQLLAGTLIGVPAAIVGLVFGIPGMAVATLGVVVAGLIPRLPALVAGGLIGLGATWFVLLARAASLCSQPGQVCGGSPPEMVPWLFVSGAIALVGVLVGGYAIKTRQRR